MRKRERTRLAKDHPIILAPQPRADYFHNATIREGGLLDLAKCSRLTRNDFLPVALRIAARVDSWCEEPRCRRFFDRLYAGFVVNPSANAFAVWDPAGHILAVNTGLVWLLHELFCTLFSHPLFAPEIGGGSGDAEPFDSIRQGFWPQSGIVHESPLGVFFRSHPRATNEHRQLVAVTMSQMAVEFAFYHELGHLVGGHAGFIAASAGTNGIHELDTRPAGAGIPIPLRRALEFEADNFAVQAAIANRLMLKYVDTTETYPGESSPFERAYYCWSMALAGVFRLFSQQGLDIAGYDSRTHPHPLARALAAGLYAVGSTAMPEMPQRERFIDLCCRAPLDLARYWRQFQIPGHQFDTVADEGLLYDAERQLGSAIETLIPLQQELSRFAQADVLEAITKGAHPDSDILRSIRKGDL
jgi:hypothetical protein